MAVVLGISVKVAVGVSLTLPIATGGVTDGVGVLNGEINGVVLELCDSAPLDGVVMVDGDEVADATADEETVGVGDAEGVGEPVGVPVEDCDGESLRVGCGVGVRLPLAPSVTLDVGVLESDSETDGVHVVDGVGLFVGDAESVAVDVPDAVAVADADAVPLLCAELDAVGSDDALDVELAVDVAEDAAVVVEVPVPDAVPDAVAIAVADAVPDAVAEEAHVAIDEEELVVDDVDELVAVNDGTAVVVAMAVAVADAVELCDAVVEIEVDVLAVRLAHSMSLGWEGAPHTRGPPRSTPSAHDRDALPPARVPSLQSTTSVIPLSSPGATAGTGAGENAVPFAPQSTETAVAPHTASAPSPKRRGPKPWASAPVSAASVAKRDVTGAPVSDLTTTLTAPPATRTTTLMGVPD